jgi:hypothetical protein
MVRAKVGMRIHVFSGIEQKPLGMGTIEKVEPVYIGDDKKYAKLSDDYPSRIKLDSGQIMQGCECWWVSDRQHKLALAKLRKEKLKDGEKG